MDWIADFCEWFRKFVRKIDESQSRPWQCGQLVQNGEELFMQTPKQEVSLLRHQKYFGSDCE